MKTKTYRYSVDYPDYDGATKIKSTWDIDNIEYVAEDCAEHHYKENDWREFDAPEDFYIWDDMARRYDFQMGVEYEPSFYIEKNCRVGENKMTPLQAIKKHCKECFSMNNRCEKELSECPFYQFQLFMECDECDSPGTDRMDGHFCHGRLCDKHWEVNDD